MLYVSKYLCRTYYVQDIIVHILLPSECIVQLNTQKISIVYFTHLIKFIEPLIRGARCW